MTEEGNTSTNKFINPQSLKQNFESSLSRALSNSKKQLQ